MDSSSSSSFSLLFCIILMIILYAFPQFIPHDETKVYVKRLKKHGGSDSSSDFSMSDLS